MSAALASEAVQTAFQQCSNTSSAVLTPSVLTPTLAVLTPPLAQDFCSNVRTRPLDGGGGGEEVNGQCDEARATPIAYTLRKRKYKI